MFAIECFHDRLCQRRVLGVADHHARPRHHLKDRPVHADRESQRQGNQQFGQPREHGTKLYPSCEASSLPWSVVVTPKAFGGRPLHKSTISQLWPEPVVVLRCTPNSLLPTVRAVMEAPRPAP